MATTAEDNFRIEVWDREEKALVETICRSPDSFVSQAAWQTAIRAPQTIVEGSIHAGLDVSLSDLRKWHMLRPGAEIARTMRRSRRPPSSGAMAGTRSSARSKGHCLGPV